MDRQDAAQRRGTGRCRRFIQIGGDLRHRACDRLQSQCQEAHQIGNQDDPGRGVETADEGQRAQEQKDAGNGKDDARQRIGDLGDALQDLTRAGTHPVQHDRHRHHTDCQDQCCAARQQGRVLERAHGGCLIDQHVLIVAQRCRLPCQIDAEGGNERGRDQRERGQKQHHRDGRPGEDGKRGAPFSQQDGGGAA